MIISIINQKGGVGKSTTAQNLGAGLADAGYNVLLVDLDNQCNLSYSLDALDKQPTIYDVLTGSAKAEEAIVEAGRVKLIPSSSFLVGADKLLSDTGSEYRLKEALASIKKKFDFILIDTPPALGILTINALTASDKLLIPSQADIFSIQGIAQLYNSVEAVKKYTNKGLSILGILLTRFNGKTAISKGMVKALEAMASEKKTEIFKTSIRECVAVKEAQTMKKDIFTYSRKSNATRDYQALVNEVLAKLNKKRK